MTAPRDLSHRPPSSPRAWEVTLAWLFRVLIVATGAIHVWQGKYMYALMCAAVIIVLVVPPLLARTSRANMPVELELASLWAAVSDMTLGRLAGLYAGTVWFDKLLHFGNSMLIGMLAFLIVYALQFTARLRTLAIVNGLVILLLSLGIGAVWKNRGVRCRPQLQGGSARFPGIGSLGRHIEAFASLIPAPR